MMKKMLGKLFRDSKTDKAIRNRKILHFPDDLTAPAKLAVYARQRKEDIWAALFLMHSLQTHFPDAEHILVCRERDVELAGMLRTLPKTISYLSSPGQAIQTSRKQFGEDTIIFYPYVDIDEISSSFLIYSGAGICISTVIDRVINLTVKVNTHIQPEHIFKMCEVLGIKPDMHWKPSVPREDSAKANSILSPVTGRAMPYIVATTETADILEKSRSEIPVRILIIDGKRQEIPDVSRGVMAAIVGGATAVATTDPWLWLKGWALEVPTVGFDKRKRFPNWGTEPAATEEQFLEQWAELLRRGW